MLSSVIVKSVPRSLVFVLIALGVVGSLGACAKKSIPKSSLLAPGAGNVPTAVDARIRFWKSRLPRDPEDSTAAEQLASAYLHKAKTTGDFGYYIEAERLLTPIYEFDPDNYLALTLLASAKAAQHKFLEALILSEKAVTLKTEGATAYALLFDTKLEIGDLTGAEQALADLERRQPGFPTLTRRANLMVAKGDLPKAFSSLESALALAEVEQLSSDDLAWGHVRIGALFFDSGRYTEADKHYQAALRFSPESYLVFEHIAELLCAKGQFTDALALYDKVIAKSASPEFFEAIAQVYRKMGRNAEALKSLDQAENAGLKHLKAGDIGYYRFLANFYADRKLNPELALKYARADLEVRHDAHTYETYAWALYRNGEFRSAAQAMETALASGIEDALVHRRAAEIFAARGNEQRVGQHRDSKGTPHSEFIHEQRPF